MTQSYMYIIYVCDGGKERDKSGSCRGVKLRAAYVAATGPNGINKSRWRRQHSFPLMRELGVFHFLTENTAKELLEQAAIASPI